MNDLIERDKAIEAVEEGMCTFYDCYVIEKLKEVSPWTTVSVVRCEECMFSKVYQNDSSGVMGRFCEAFTQVRMVTDDDYCSYGERKDFQVIVNGNCTKCGKPLSGNRIFICEECEEQNKESE